MQAIRGIQQKATRIAVERYCNRIDGKIAPAEIVRNTREMNLGLRARVEMHIFARAAEIDPSTSPAKTGISLWRTRSFSVDFHPRPALFQLAYHPDGIALYREVKHPESAARK